MSYLIKTVLLKHSCKETPSVPCEEKAFKYFNRWNWMPVVCILDELCNLGFTLLIRQAHFNSHESHAFTEASEGKGSLDHIPEFHL